MSDMKRKKNLIFLPLLALLLTACDSFNFRSSSSQDSITPVSEISSLDGSTEASTEVSSEVSTEVSSETTEESSSTSSAVTSEESRPTSGTETIDFYAINDTHGAILARPEIDEPGLAKVGAFLKNKKVERPDNTVIISTGDMWQGTFEAYHSKGEVVTHAMNEIGFDLMAIGNHEFDWGPEYILNNMAIADFPFLGANIMKYPETTEKSPVGEDYIILERSHLKIGIIGAIGQDQMTSICSRLIEDIYFENIVPVVKRLSTKLREEENVDIVVLAIHAGQDDVANELAEDKYVDAVFNAHTHRYETKTVAGVPFIQGGSKGRFVSHIELEYDYGANTVQALDVKNISMVTAEITPDPAVAQILSNYKAESDAISEVYVGHNVRHLDRYYEIPRILNYIIAEKAAEQNFNLDYVYNGDSRESILGGDVTYGDLYKALPFDNITYIVSVLGRDLINQKPYNKFYRVHDYSVIHNDQYYTVAIQDYSILHQDINKVYNYFPGYNPDEHFIGFISDENKQPILPRDLLMGEFLDSPDFMLDAWDAKYGGERHEEFTAP